MVKTDFRSLSFNGPSYLIRMAPDVIITHLVGEHHDVVDVVELMKEAQLSSELLIISPRLPRPNIVLNELRGQYKQLSVRFYFDGVMAEYAPEYA